MYTLILEKRLLKQNDEDIATLIQADGTTRQVSVKTLLQGGLIILTIDVKTEEKEKVKKLSRFPRGNDSCLAQDLKNFLEDKEMTINSFAREINCGFRTIKEFVEGTKEDYSLELLQRIKGYIQ